MNKTYEVRRGDTLSLIARRHQTTVEALVQANGIANPDLIHVGQVLLIPAPPRTPDEQTGPCAPGPAPVELGSLSRKYEAFGPGTVSTGKGDAGGVSYGSYQFSTRTGSAQAFVDSLRRTHPHYHAVLSGSAPGTEAFSQAWRALAHRDPEGFDRAQHDAIQRTHYEPAVLAIQRATGLDVNTRSHALRDVTWSTAVQHGPLRADDLFKAALRGRSPSRVDDAELIRCVYAERGRRNAQGGLVHFSSSSQAVQQSVARRFRDEERDALELLARERAGAVRGLPPAEPAGVPG